MTWTKAETEAAREELRTLLKPGDTIQVLWRHTARSGMARWYDVYFLEGNGPCWIGRLVAQATDHAWSDRWHGVHMGGCGMDMRFGLTYNLGRALWPEGFSAWQGYWRNHEFAEGEIEKDSGYALKFQAL